MDSENQIAVGRGDAGVASDESTGLDPACLAETDHGVAADVRAVLDNGGAVDFSEIADFGAVNLCVAGDLGVIVDAGAVVKTSVTEDSGLIGDVDAAAGAAKAGIALNDRIASDFDLVVATNGRCVGNGGAIADEAGAEEGATEHAGVVADNGVATDRGFALHASEIVDLSLVKNVGIFADEPTFVDFGVAVNASVVANPAETVLAEVFLTFEPAAQGAFADQSEAELVGGTGVVRFLGVEVGGGADLVKRDAVDYFGEASEYVFRHLAFPL